MPAMFKPGFKVVTAMTEEQFDREKRYQASMSMFRTMLKNGLITEEQYAIIDTKCWENTAHYWERYSQNLLAIPGFQSDV